MGALTHKYYSLLVMAVKYNSKTGKYTYRGISFDSRSEAEQYERSHVIEMTGNNTGLSTFDDFWNKTTGAGQTNAERQAQEFEHNEAILQWQRNEDSADRAMERTRELRQTAYADQVQSAQDAGINPIFAVTGGLASAPGAVAQSQAASSAAPRNGGLADIASVLSALSQSKKNVAEANLAQTQAERFNEVTDTELSEARQRISQMGNQMHNDTLRAASESMLNYATSENIRAMQPYNMEYQMANTDKAREEAALAGVKAAWDSGLINRGYLDELVHNLEKDSDLKNSQFNMNYLEYVFKTGKNLL